MVTVRSLHAMHDVMHEVRRKGPSMRRRRLLFSLLLAAAAGLGTAAVPPMGGPGAAAPAATPLDQVIPAPASVRGGGEAYTLGDGTRIRVPGGSGEAKKIAGYLAGLLRPATGYAPSGDHQGRPGRHRPAARRQRHQGPGRRGLPADLRRPAVTISAARPAGLFHGVQTLRQLLPADVERQRDRRGPWRIAGGTIADSPRYAYRGAMLDVSRHFFTVAQVKRYIDQLAMYKINKLHLHLSDDQGWRIAIKSWPRLATYGGSTQVGGGPGGYYTQDEYREIVRYAAARYLTVVPEIDMPGHTNAALASYAELNCDGAGAAALHRHRGRLQLAVRGQGGDVRVRGRRHPRAGGPDARPLPPHRRRRGALHQPCGLRDLHGQGAAGGRQVRQDA